MFKVKSILFVALLAVIFAGCGSQNGISKGDRFVVLEEIRERAEIEGQAANEGFSAVLKKNTVLEVVFSPRQGAGVIEVVPVEIEGNNLREEVMASFIPEHLKTRYGEVSYSIALKDDYVGTKIKKVTE